MDRPETHPQEAMAKSLIPRKRLLEDSSLGTPVAEMRSMWGLISAYWRSEEKKTAWMLVGAMAGLIVVDSAMAAGMTFVLKDITDAILSRNILNVSTALNTAAYFAFASLGLPAVSSTKDYLGNLWQIKWEGWLTKTFKKAKDMNNAMAHIMNLPGAVKNPDQVMTEGIEKTTQHVSGLGHGVFSAFVNIATRTSVLAAICDTTTVNILDRAVVVPGQTFWISSGVAIALAAVQTMFNMKFGKSLDTLNFNQTVRDADFRTRELKIWGNAGQILAYGSDAIACHGEDESFARVQQNRKDFARAKLSFNAATRSYAYQTAFGYYIAGGVLFSLTKMSWGLGTQLVNTVHELQTNLAWFGNVVPDVSQAKSWAIRLTDLATQIELAQDPNKFYAQDGSRADIAVTKEMRSSILLKDIVIDNPTSGEEILYLPELEVLPGRRYLIAGKSGCGKSCLLKIPFEQWYYGRGECHIPDNKNIMLATSYIVPDATLRENIAFPVKDVRHFPNADYVQALREAQLDYLIPFLDEKSRKGSHWEDLSRGEKERLVFARAFLQKPDYLFLDEPTSNMDDQLQNEMMLRLPRLLPDSAIVAVVHGDINLICNNFTNLIEVQADKTVQLTAILNPAANLIPFRQPTFVPASLKRVI